MTMMSELGTYLAANGGGVVVGTDLFYGTMPTSPAVCASFVEYEGRGYVRRQGGARCEMARMQLLYRAESYEAAVAAIRTMAFVLDNVVNLTLSGTFYQRVEALQPPFFLERDANDRFVFAVNFEITREST